jgi:short-subunit dehydrogenase
MRFENTIALITGATSGIGLSTAKHLADEGATVIGTGRNPERLKELMPFVTTTFSMDVTDDESVAAVAKAVTERFGALDLLINNAGIGTFKSWDETSVDEVRRIMETNLFGVIRVTNAFLPAMVTANSGVVLNIASVAGKRAYPKHTAYCASKHALIGWSEGLRLDLAESSVDVVVVLPPAVATPFFVNSDYHTFDEDHPGLKLIGPDDVAKAVLNAAEKRPRQQIITARAKVLYGLSVLSPDLVDILRRFK